MRSLFVIRAADSTYCTVSKYNSFGSFEDAVLFNSQANAEKAVSEMTRRALPSYLPELEVVEYILTPNA